MAGIVADATQFWQRLLAELKAGMPTPENGKDYTNKDIEKHFGISKNSVTSLFGAKSRNYQVKWTDEQMEAFIRGEPLWEDKKALLASIMWGSAASARCRKLAIERKEFESVVAEAFDPSLSDWENWRRGCEAADRLALQKATGLKESVKRIVENQAAHFIGKITNSNATTGAVLASPDPDPQPYLYSGSLGEIPLDCAVASREDAASYRRMRDCFMRVKEVGRDTASAEDIEIADTFEATLESLGTGEERPINRGVDYRLKQIVVPKEDGYVALTPLGAMGISEIIFGIDEKKEHGLPGREIVLKIGGSKPRNVTSFLSVAGRVIVRETPAVTENGISRYLRLQTRGYSITLSKPLREALDHYGSWLEKNRFVDDRDSVRASEIEVASSGLSRIVSLVLDGIRGLSDDIQDYLGSLDESEYQEKIDALFAKGPIEAAIATGDFTPEAINAISEMIITLIDRHKFTNDQNKLMPVAFGIADRNRLKRSIQMIMARTL